MTTQETRPLPTSVRDALIWLQEQMTQLRDLTARLQQETGEVLGKLTAIDGRVDEIHDRLAQSDRERAGLSRLREEVGETRELASQLQERLSESLLRTQESDRQRDLDVERDRQARTDLARQIGELSQTTEATEQRFRVQDEAQQQLREAAITLRQDTDDIRLATKSLLSREETLSESMRRSEVRMSGLETKQVDGERRMEVVEERLQLTLDQTRRAEQDMTVLAQRLSTIDDLKEQIEVLRAERARFETRVQGMELRNDQMDAGLAEQVALSARLLGRFQGVDERLLQLQTDLAGLTETVVTQMVRFGQTLERQKRRQIGDLEREIRELKQHATRISEE